MVESNNSLPYSMHLTGAGSTRWGFDTHKDERGQIHVDELRFESKGLTAKFNTNGHGHFQIARGKVVDKISFGEFGVQVSRDTPMGNKPLTDGPAREALTYAQKIAGLPLQHALEQHYHKGGGDSPELKTAAKTAAEMTAKKIGEALNKLGPAAQLDSTPNYRHNYALLRRGGIPDAPSPSPESPGNADALSKQPASSRYAKLDRTLSS